jgi:Phosphoenolpyruvate carboxylase
MELKNRRSGFHAAPFETFMTSTLNSTSMNDVSAKELPLVDDIRFFGQLLGDTIREQEGEETYELIETIRKLSIAFERDADPDACRKLGALLRGLTADQAMAVLRAFTYFSHCQHYRGPALYPAPCCSRNGATAGPQA